MADPLSYKNDADEDDRLNPAELAEQEKAAGKAQTDKSADASEDTIQDQEENPFSYSSEGSESSSGGAKGLLKKFGPTGGIVGLIIGLLFGGSILTGPGLLLVQVKEVLTNHGSSASKAAPKRFEETLYYRLSGGKEIEAACKKTFSIKCKRGTMKDKTVARLRAVGFEIESKQVGDRHIVSKMTLGETTIDSSKSVKAALKDPAFAGTLNRVINPRSLVFIGDRFSAKVLKKFGLNKSKVVLDGKDEEERKKSINKQIGGGESESEREAKLRTAVDSKTENIKAKYAGIGGKVTSATTAAAGLACLGYNISRATIAAVKINNMAKYAAFAMLFLKAADQIKADGEIDPETVATLATILTTTAATGPTKGLSATDSQGFKVAAYGGERGLKSWTKNYMLGGSKGLNNLEGSIDWLNNNTPGGKSSVHGVCKAGTSFATGAVITLGLCGIGGGGSVGAVATTIFPVVGTAAGWAVGTAGCTALSFAGGLAAGFLVGKLIGLLLPKLVGWLSDSNIDATKIYGVDAGNVTAMGAGVVLEQTNMSRGLQPGTKESVGEFQATLQESERDYELAMRHEAKQTPFDIYNQYSFLGSFIRNTGVTYNSSWSVAQLFKNTSSLAFSGVGIMPKAFAAASMPVSITEEDLSDCPDTTLSNIGVDCDTVGGTQFTMPTDIPVKENLDFMIPKYVNDDSHKPIPGTDYEKWTKYCTEQREDPLGVTSVPIEDETTWGDDGPTWETGEACLPTDDTKEMLDQFSTYYFDDASRQDEDGEVEGEEDETAEGIGTVMSFNVLGADKDGMPWSARKEHVINTILARSPDIIGLQEMNEDVQHEDLQASLTEYSSWDGGEGGEGAKRPIYWKSASFDKVDGGLYKYQRYSDSEKQPAPWVKLKKKSNGSEIFVFNYHGIAHDSNADKKIEGAEDTVEAIDKIAGSSAPVVLLGDFNSDYGKFAHPIILAAGFVDTFQVADIKINADYETHHDDPPKPRTKGTKHIDHIFVRPSMPVTVWENIIDEETTQASDHSPIIATIAGEKKDGGVGKLGELCKISDPKLNESSGLAASVKHPGVVYTHNDEGNTIWAINIDDCAVLGKFTVSGTRDDPDPEAISIDHTTGKIWFGDIGNGHPAQPSSFTDKKKKIKYPGLPARIVVFDEPDQFSGNITNVQPIDIRYPNGDQNSEALLVNPITGQGYMMNKMPTTTLYKLPKPLRSEKATIVSAQIIPWVTDAAFTNDGKWVLVRYRTDNPAPNDVKVYNADTWQLDGTITVPSVAQGESITVEKGGKSFLIGSEKAPSPIVRVALPSKYTSGGEDGSGGGDIGEIIDGPSRQGWVWPVPGTTRSDHGTLPYQGNSPGDHKGIDIAKVGGSPGKEVVAAHKGTVTQSYYSGACGYFVVIKAEGTSYWAAYQHLTNKGNHPKRGDPVSAGMVIGRIRESGENTGSCTGGSYEHLHFSVETRDGISFRGGPGYTIDPLKVLP